MIQRIDIDLAACSRSEAKAFVENLEGYIKHLESENHILNLKLQEYEGIETKDEFNAWFEKFWARHGKKGNRKTALARAKRLSKKVKSIIDEHHPKYVKSTPDIQFRKNAEVYLSRECWNDEIINTGKPEPVRPIPTETSAEKEKRLEELRQKNQKVNVKERILKQG